MHTEEAFPRALGERDGERARLVVLLLGHTEDIGALLGVRERAPWLRALLCVLAEERRV